MVVVVVWFCCSSWLAFLTLTYYSNLMHQSLLHWVICFGGYLIVHTEFFEKDLGFFGIRKKNNFWVFLSVPHLVDNYAKIVDGRGRNLMCHRTLPSRLVGCLVSNVKKDVLPNKMWFFVYSCLRFYYCFASLIFIWTPMSEKIFAAVCFTTYS